MSTSRIAQLTSVRRQSKPIFAIYGTPGVGKTSLAAEFPSPIYLFANGEEPPDDIDLPGEEIKSFEDLLNVFGELLTEEHSFKTVIIDSLDKIEPMIWAATCARNGWDTIDSNDKGSPASVFRMRSASSSGKI